MRATTIGSLTAAVALAALVPLVPATAGAAATDFRTEACRGADHDGIASGTPSRATVLTAKVRDLGAVTITGERLTYANGARCDLLHLDGRLPFGQELRKVSGDIADMGDLVVAGVDRGDSERNATSVGFGTTPGVHELDQQVLGAVVYLPSETGTMPDSPALPADWRNQPFSFTHTRTTLAVTFTGRRGTEKSFTVTPATRAAAARQLARDLDAATSAADRRDARRTHRLALQGIRLVMKPFRASWSGELPG